MDRPPPAISFATPCSLPDTQGQRPRAAYPDSNLAQLYDPLTMPPDLSKAHQRLDQAVDKSYGNLKFESEGARMSYLFQCYQKATASILLGRIRA